MQPEDGYLFVNKLSFNTVCHFKIKDCVYEILLQTLINVVAKLSKSNRFALKDMSRCI